jgi:signal transduction histidine kinase
MKQHDPLSTAGVVHDLNNVLQTLIGVALQTGDEAASAAILRSVERARGILAELQDGPSGLLPLESIVSNATAFARDHSGAAVEVVSKLSPAIQLPAAFERVLINLFLNSVRAMGDSGTIHVTARPEGDSLCILVSDEGPGIPAELLERLFEPHVSGNGSSGLGLNIVHSIVQSHGGSVQAANGAVGAEFRIVVPLRGQARSSVAGV